jgi:hypothetical protein
VNGDMLVSRYDGRGKEYQKRDEEVLKMEWV